jgi:hypothetical protein
MNIPLSTNHRTSRNYYQSSRQIFTTDSPITDLQCPRCPSYTERYIFKPSTSPHSEVVSLRYFPCQRDNKTTKLHRPSLLPLPSQKPLTSFTKISRETTHILHLLRAIPPPVTTSHIKIFRPSTNLDSHSTSKHATYHCTFNQTHRISSPSSSPQYATSSTPTHPHLPCNDKKRLYPTR